MPQERLEQTERDETYASNYHAYGYPIYDDDDGFWHSLVAPLFYPLTFVLLGTAIMSPHSIMGLPKAVPRFDFPHSGLFLAFRLRSRRASSGLRYAARYGLVDSGLSS